MIDKLETCKNCAWWRPEVSPDPDEYDARDLDAHWLCGNPLLGRNPRGDAERYAVITHDPPCTGPDFGCIHWQVKEPF